MNAQFIGIGLLDAEHDFGLGTPQPFQVIKMPLGFQKDMDDDDAIIHQHPAAFRLAFGGIGQQVIMFFDALADVVDQGFELAVAVTVANHEKVSDDRVGAQVEQHDVFGFFILDHINDMSCKF